MLALCFVLKRVLLTIHYYPTYVLHIPQEKGTWATWATWAVVVKGSRFFRILRKNSFFCVFTVCSICVHFSYRLYHMCLTWKKAFLDLLLPWVTTSIYKHTIIEPNSLIVGSVEANHTFKSGEFCDFIVSFTIFTHVFLLKDQTFCHILSVLWCVYG